MTTNRDPMKQHVKKLTSLTMTALLLTSSACSGNRSRKPEVTLVKPSLAGGGDFKVSVTTDGHAVKDFEEKLVHYVVLSRGQLVTIVDSLSNPTAVPFVANTESGRMGEVVGLRVNSVKDIATLNMLGLEQLDVITALGLDRPKTEEDLGRFYDQLSEKGEGTVTLIRRGKPHKIIYSTTDSHKQIGRL